jgi:hypothetical protein
VWAGVKMLRKDKIDKMLKCVKLTKKDKIDMIIYTFGLFILVLFQIFLWYLLVSNFSHVNHAPVINRIWNDNLQFNYYIAYDFENFPICCRLDYNIHKENCSCYYVGFYIK